MNMTSNVSDLVKVKPLAWWLSDTGDLCADTLIGRYQLQKSGSRWCCMYAQGMRVISIGERKETSWHDSEMDAKAAAQHDFESRLLAALTPAEQCFSVKPGYSVTCRHHIAAWRDPVPLTEALTIRSAEEVRREALDRVEELLHEVAAGDLGVYEVIDTMRSIATDFPCSETKPSTEKMAIIDPAIIDLIGELGREVYYLLDDSEESGPIGDTAITVDKEQFDKVSAILNRIEALPYEEPGCILGVGAKLQAALKQAHVILPLSPDGHQALDDVRAKAWDEGYDQALKDDFGSKGYTQNPYRTQPSRSSDAGKSEDQG